MPGLSSLFISFNYNAAIVEMLKTLPNFTYDAKTHIWETPVTNLSKLLTQLNTIDDITLKLLKDKKQPTHENIELHHYKTTPYEYQKQGIEYGLQKGHEKFLLLDAPGLGKSLQLIYLAQELKEREGLKHCLVICGVNTLKLNWKNEITRHSDLSCRILGERVNKKGKLTIGSVKDRLEDLKNPIKEFFVITNIETLRNDDIIKEILKGKNNQFDMIVVDEIHTCKSNTSQQGKNLLKLNKAPHLIGATGTLLLNNPVDAYVPLKWIGAENGTFTNFKYYYCNYTGQFNNILLGFRNLKILQDQIDRYSLRRTKDLLDLPPKNIINEIVEMEPSQAKFYENIKNGIIDEVDKVELKPAALLSMVTRLRQATSCPAILSSSDIDSSKISRACDLVEQIISNNEKVVIFSAFKQTLDVLKDKLSTYNPLLCTGDIKDNIISENIEQFQNNPDCKIMLATVQKMGTGITLTSATNEIFIDCAWTQAQNLQCEDRIYRIGSQNPVFIYYLWNNDTIDLRVKEIVESKEAIADFIVDGTCPPRLAAKLKEIVQDLRSE